MFVGDNYLVVCGRQLGRQEAVKRLNSTIDRSPQFSEI